MYISLQEFMRRNKIGQNVAYQLLKSGKYKYEITKGGRYKIFIDEISDNISLEKYEKIIRENEKYKNTLNSILNQLKEVLNAEI